jgi:hypothetical protein
VSALAFVVTDVVAQEHAAAPHLLFRLRVTESTGARVHALALRCQVRIEPQRRPYDAEEQAGLTDLFGGTERYASTLKPFLWAHAGTLVQGFEGSTEVELPLAVSYDVEVAAGKYLHALRGGDVPLSLLFSGTVFTRGETGFAVEQLSWSCEAACRMPVPVWRDLMDHYFPGGGWIRLDRATIDALLRFRAERGLTSWESTFAELLPATAVTS